MYKFLSKVFCSKYYTPFGTLTKGRTYTPDGRQVS